MYFKIILIAVFLVNCNYFIILICWFTQETFLIISVETFVEFFGIL